MGLVRFPGRFTPIDGHRTHETFERDVLGPLGDELGERVVRC
jgi:hypothetical protein